LYQAWRSGTYRLTKELRMSRTASVVLGHETRRVQHGKLRQGVAHVPPGEGIRSLWVLSELVTYKIPSHQTGGAYALFEVSTAPGAGPPPHIHHREDECFYVLEGEYEFLAGKEILRVGVGSLLYVPKGTLHTHRGVGEGMGRMLATQTPGGLYERFFEEPGMPVNGDGGQPFTGERPESVERIVEVAAEHGTEIPPLTVKGRRPPSTRQGVR
jgi:mannose-6-phosphate isomerase-like protein (cupin superfamily)